MKWPLCRCFLWTGTDNDSKARLVCWKDMCKVKISGALGFRDLETWNLAAINKLACILLKGKRICGLSEWATSISRGVIGVHMWPLAQLARHENLFVKQDRMPMLDYLVINGCSMINLASKNSITVWLLREPKLRFNGGGMYGINILSLKTGSSFG